MRNLKRALSLTLASVMLLGMMVVGAGAAGYKDVTDDHNVEAIEVLQAVGAMVGDEAGNFDPDANVNRAQIATIMSRLLDLKVEDFNAADIPFTDVPEWAVPFVAACYADGITSGVSATAYGSNNSVTAAQAALMMMKALGYFQYQDDFGQDWQLATIKQASEIGLFNGVTVDRTSALTRNDVAQMALNALKSNMVSFTGDVGSTYTVNGETIRVGYKPEYTVKTSADPIYNRIDNLATTIDKPTGQYEMQLGEYLYAGKLTLTSTVDVFGRPARYWELDGEEIGTYVKEELLKTQYTTSVTGKTLYDLLGSSTIKDYEFNVTIDGESDPEVFGGFTNNYNKQDYYTIFNKTHLNRNNDAKVGGTGNGVLTQVFVDTNDKTVYIAVINTYLAKADDDYNEKKEQVGLDVYDIRKDAYVKSTYIKDTTNAGYSENIIVTAEEFDVADVAKGDFFLVTVADGAIQSMRDPEVLSAVEISSFSKNNSLTTEGTKYDYADTLRYDKDTLERWTDGQNKVNLKDLTYNVYLDQYGYAIGVKESDAPKNYMFITGVNGDFNNLVNINLEANAIFLDGTMETIRINGRKSDFKNLDVNVDTGATVNRWFTYTKGTNGVYNVTLVEYGVKDKLGQFHEDRDGNNTPVDYKHHNVKVDNASNPWYTDAAGNVEAQNNVKNPHVVYSDDNTVFLTVGLDNLHTSASHYAAVISDVDSVSVGIDNVDITAWDHNTVSGMSEFAAPHGVVTDDLHDSLVDDYTNAWCDHSYGTYSLYNSDGYIIGMVVVGQDNGTSDNLVFVHSGDVKDESYDKATEEWTWTRKAIVAGEEVELVEVNDNGISLLEAMDKCQWYRVRYNADGEVTGVTAERGDTTALDYDADYSDWKLDTAPYAYVTSYNNDPIWSSTDPIYKAVTATGVDVVLYHEQFFNVKPSNSGHTLYMTNDKNEASGVRYTEDTSIVFIQTERNKTYTEFWKGQSGVEKALKALHDLDKYNTNKSYEISVLWKDGRATTIIIQDLNALGQDGEWDSSRKGYVYFEDTQDMDWEARFLTIIEGNTKVTDGNEGRFFFQMQSALNTAENGWFDIDNDGDGQITYKYKAFAHDTKTNETRQIGSIFTAQMNLDVNEKTPFIYAGEVQKLGHTFNSTEELYIAIVDVLNGTRTMTGDVDPGVPPIVPTFEGEDQGDPFGPSYPGQKAKIVISLPAVPRAAGDPAAALVEGRWYTVVVNGQAANPNPVQLVNGKMTVTHTITVADIAKGELVITGILEAKPGEGNEPGTDPKPPVTATAVTSVTISGIDSTEYENVDALPGTVTVVAEPEGSVADSATVTWGEPAEDGTVTGTVKLSANKDFKFTKDTTITGGTASLTANAGSVEVTVSATVNVTEKPGDFTVKVTGEAPGMEFALSYTGEKPTDSAALLGAINKALKEAGYTEVAASIGPDGVTVFDKDVEQLGTIQSEGSFSLYVNGAKVNDVELKTSATADQTVKLTGSVAAYLIPEGKKATTSTSSYVVTSGLTSSTITIPKATLNGLTGDLKLVNGYRLVAGSGVGLPKYTLPGADGAKGDASENDVFPDGTQFVFEGTQTNGNGTNLTFTLGEYKDSKPAAAQVTKWTVTFDADTMLNENSQIKAKEEVTTVTTLKIGSQSWTVTGALSTEMTVKYAGGAMPKVVDYVDVTSGEMHSKNRVTAALVGNNVKLTFTTTPSADENGVIKLAPAVKVTFGADGDANYGGSDVAISANDVLYVAAGAQMVAKFDDGAETDRMTVTCDEKVLAAEIGAGPYNYTIPTNLTAAQLTAGLEVNVEKAVGAITYALGDITASTNADTVRAFFTGGGVTNDNVVINVEGANNLNAGETSNITVTIVAADGFYFPANYAISKVKPVDVGGVPTITIKIAVEIKSAP